MKHAQFEQLVLVTGGAAILGTIVFAIPAWGLDPAEIVGQLLLLAVLYLAVRFGRKGGTWAAMLAVAIYAMMRIPMFAGGEVTPAAALMVLTRFAAYGLVGIVGGYVLARMKYSIARIESGSALDEWSLVYNQAYLHEALAQATARNQRYTEPVCMILITLSGSLFEGLRPARQRSLVRAVADHIRADLRLVDSVARLDDGRFAILLPHTPKSGGGVVAERLLAGVRRTLGSRDESVSARCLGLPEDADAFRALSDALVPTPDDSAP